MMLYKPYMMQFVSLLVLLGFILCSGMKKSALVKRIVLTLVFIFLASIFINRDYGQNIDLPIYMNFYEENQLIGDVFAGPTAWKGDYFFFSLMPLAHLFGLSAEQYITFQLLLSLFIVFLAYDRFFQYHKSWVFLALFFTINSSSFYLIHGNVIRQGFASALLLLTLTPMAGVKEFMLKTLAFLSHKGSLLSFLAPFSPQKKNILIPVLVGAAVFGFFSIGIFMIYFLPLPGFVVSKLNFYSEFERSSANSLLKFALLLLFNALILLFGIHKPRFLKVYAIFIVFSVGAFLLYRFDGMFSRLILYTDVFLPILTIGVIERIESKKIKHIVLLISILLSGLYSVYVFNHPSILFNIGEWYHVF